MIPVTITIKHGKPIRYLKIFSYNVSHQSNVGCRISSLGLSIVLWAKQEVIRLLQEFRTISVL